jgi:DNA-binding NarL/FixJ family response regulator
MRIRPPPRSTDGELHVVAAVAQGMSNRGIAKELHLSRHTVDAHLKHVYLKLDIHTRVQLTVPALQHSASLFTAHPVDRE